MSSAVGNSISGSGRVSGYYFLTEGIPDESLNYDGSKFMVCGRCKKMYYKDREAQKKHWKIHKSSCRSLVVREIENSLPTTLSGCFRALTVYNGLRDMKGGPELPYLIQRIRSLLDNEDGELSWDEVGDMALHLHSFARGVIFDESNIMLHAMARPGMPKLMLETTEKPIDMNFCYLYFNLLVAAVIYGQPSMCSIHDGRGILRGSHGPRDNPDALLCVAALRRAMQLWSNPQILASCMDALAPAASLALTVIDHYKGKGDLGHAHCRTHEIIPGLKVDALVITCLNEWNEEYASAFYAAKILKQLSQISLTKRDEPCWERLFSHAEEDTDANIDQLQLFWDTCGTPKERLSIKARAKVALALINFIATAKAQDHRFCDESEKDPPKKECGILLQTVCGLLNNNVDEDVQTSGGTDTEHAASDTLAKRIFQLAASEEGERLGPKRMGQNHVVRAFCHFVLLHDRYQTLSPCGPNWNVVKYIRYFYKIPTTSHATGNTLIVAQEKEICLKLARGEA